MLCRNYKPSYLFKLHCILIVHKKIQSTKGRLYWHCINFIFKASFFFGIMNFSYYIFNVNTFVSLKKREKKQPFRNYIHDLRVTS